MRQIKLTIEPRWDHQVYTSIIEVDDDATDDDIDEVVADEVNNVCSYGWTEIPVD